MRILYQECKLVHADLSEYNMLYYEKKLYFIDVSQSVEHDHPHSLDFLRRDITNINDFFQKKSVQVFSIKVIFNYIVSVTIGKDNERNALQDIVEQYTENDNDRDDEEWFKKVSIPRHLDNISMEKIEKEIYENGQTKTLHSAVTGLEIK